MDHKRTFTAEVKQKSGSDGGTIKKIEIRRDVIEKIMDRYGYTDEIRDVIRTENLLPEGLLSRLHTCYRRYSGILESTPFLFNGKERYAGLKGFKEIVEVLKAHGIDIGYIKERELFIEVYRFLATKHVLNKINWNDFKNDSLFQLVIPQPGMIRGEVVDQYKAAQSDAERKKIVKEYQKKTNPHDGKQLLNKPWYINEDGELEILRGSQHKYPRCQLLFDKTTQNCFTFCTYCFRHAQVRGDEDMFVQEEIGQFHDYLRRHNEVSDVLITGGDAGYMPFERMRDYVLPFIEDDDFLHVKTLRLGTRVLTYHPELILSRSYEPFLDLFRKLTDHGVQVAMMAHFSTPREVLNPSTIAAIRRLKSFGVAVKSQSPVMKHISLFPKKDGTIDIDRSAQNWIDLGNILAMLSVGFHSMYCARPTGEHHYFTAPLADIHKVFSKVYRELASINRPSRYITMTSSAGKVSLLGVVDVKGEKAFALKFNEGRNMKWLDEVYLARYDASENTIEKLQPFDTDKYFYEDELAEIERTLEESLEKRMIREAGSK